MQYIAPEEVILVTSDELPSGYAFDPVYKDVNWNVEMVDSWGQSFPHDPASAIQSAKRNLRIAATNRGANLVLGVKLAPAMHQYLTVIATGRPVRVVPFRD